MADAPSPSPYAPGIITDERLPPRPPGRPVVFLVATFVMTLAAFDHLWGVWAARSLARTDDTSPLQTIYIIFRLSGWLVLLWAYLSDAVPLFGTRRDGHLIVTCLLVALAWTALALRSPQRTVWLGAAVVFGVAASASRATIVGALAEIGQRRAVIGRLAAAHFGLTQLALLIGPPAMFAFAFAFRSVALGVGTIVGLVLVVVVLIAALASDRIPPAVLVPPEGTGIPRFLRSSAFAASLPLLVCAGLATVPTPLIGAQLFAATHRHLSELETRWTMTALKVAAAAVYLLLCRYLRFGLRLRLALLAHATALAVHTLVSRGWDLSLVDPVLMVRAAGDGLAGVALLDLAMRMAPRGREAFVAILLASVPEMTTFISTRFILVTDASVARVALFATGAAIAAAVAVSLLPRSILRAREGRAEGTMVGSPP